MKAVPRSHYHALGRNVLWKNLAETSRVFQMVFFVVVARRFGPAELGDLTVLLMVGSVIGLVFGDLGINTTMIAKMNGSRGRERRLVVSAGLFWKVVLTVLSFFLMMVSMRVSLRLGGWSEIFAVAVISCGSLWHEFTVALTNGVNRLDAEAWIRPVYRAVVYGGGALACLSLSFVGVLTWMAGGSVVVLTIVFAFVRKRVIPVGLGLNGRVADFLKDSVPVWVTQVSQLTYLKLDLVILGLVHVAARETGWYAAGWKIVDVLSVVPALLTGAALPLISGALPETNASAIAPVYLKAMYVLPFFLVLPLAIGADWVTRVLFGAAFSGTPDVLRLLVWALVPVSIHSFLGSLAVAIGRQREAAKLGAAAAGMGILAAFVLVPRFGYQYMALISLAVNSAFGVAMIIRFRDVTRSAHVSLGVKSLLSALTVFGLSFLLSRDVSAILLMASSLIIYSLMLMFLGVVTFKDLGRSWRFVGSLLWGRSVQRIGAV